MNVFDRIKTRTNSKKHHRKHSKLNNDERHLHESLTHHPHQIRAEHDKHVSRHGHRFSQGDVLAHTSLNQTLFQLNSGLVSIISYALSGDNQKRDLSRQSLLSLSGRAATEALTALDQLHQRISSTPRLALPAPPQYTKHEDGSSAEEGRSRKSKPNMLTPYIPTKEKKDVGSEILGRGGWVRNRNGSSVVLASASTSSKSSHKRSNSSRSTPLSSPREEKSDPMSKPPLKHTMPSASSRTSSIASSAVINSNNTIRQSEKRHRPAVQGMGLQPDDLIIASPDAFAIAPLSPTLPKMIPPPIPPKIPLESKPRPAVYPPQQRIYRPRPPSVATFMTASTKVGEIPEHRWNDQQALANIGPKEVKLRPLPYVIPPPLEEAKKKGRGFKFWKSSSKAAQTEVAAC